MGLREDATRGLSWSGVERWGNELLGLAVFVVLSRQLGPEAFGLVALATVVIDFGQRFVDQGFAPAVVQRGELGREHLDTAFWTGIVTGAVLTALCAGLADPIARGLGEPELAPVLRWLSLGFLIRGLSSTQQALLIRSLRFKQLAMRTLVAELCAGVVAISLALTGHGVWSLVGQSLASGAFGVVTLWSVSGWRPGFAFCWSHFRELSLFGASIVGFKLVSLLSQRIDALLIGSFLGASALGYYAVACKILNSISKALTGVIDSVAFPIFSRLQGEPQRMRRAFYEATQVTSLVTLPTFLGLAAIGPDVIPFVFGEQWGASVPVMQVFACVAVLESLTGFNGSVLKAVGKPSWRLGLAALEAAITSLAMLLVVRQGITAVALASGAVSVALYPVAFSAVRRSIGVEARRYAAQFAGPLFAALLCAGAALGVRLSAESLPVAVRIGLSILAGAFAYGIALRAAAPSTWRRALELAVAALPSLGRKEHGRAPTRAVRVRIFEAKLRAAARADFTELRDLMRDERLDPERVFALQQARAAEILRFAMSRSDFYRERCARAGIQERDLSDTEAFRSLPVLERADVREQFERICTDEATPGNFQHAVTGGTTNEPLRILRDKRMQHRTLNWRLHRWWGVEPGDNQAVIWRETSFSRWRTLRHDALWWPTRILRMDANAIDRAAVTEFVAGWERIRPALLLGYVGAVIEVARAIERSGRKPPPPKAVGTTAAPISLAQKRYLGDVFGAPVYDIYQCMEVPMLAGECPAREGLHVFADCRLVELLDDAGRPVGPGETGSVVVTDFRNRVFPFIRYRLGDRARWKQGACACGVTFPQLEPVRGRSTDSLRFPSGLVVSGDGILEIFDDSPDAVRLFQIWQTADYSLRLRCVPGKDPNAAAVMQRGIERLRKFVRNEVPVRLEVIEAIDHDRGKQRIVVSEAPGAHAPRPHGAMG
jgi:O-antigen/teichoic acid export membrane protein/phenylacetate-coenzyme A ligase PaaK-like adenylate-forming protein